MRTLAVIRSECASLRDRELTERLGRLVRWESRRLAELIAHLAEFDERKLYAEHGYPSLFAYCTRGPLGYSESAAGKRIYAARAARKFPRVLDLLAAGELHLEAVVILAPHMNDKNHGILLDRARGASKRDLERLAAGLAPKPDKPDRVRALSAPRLPACLSDESADRTTAAAKADGDREHFDGLAAAVSPDSTCVVAADLFGAAPIPARSEDAVEDSDPGRFEFTFTGGRKVREKLDRAKELLRHKYPKGRMEDIVSEALDALLDKKDPARRLERKEGRESKKRGEGSGGRERRVPDSGVRPEGFKDGSGPEATDDRGSIRRRIPQRVKDAVWRRDEGRCAFVSLEGMRCGERGHLEFDHVRPVAKGGSSTDPGNIRLACRTHNGLYARREFGTALIKSAMRRHCRGSPARP